MLTRASLLILIAFTALGASSGRAQESDSKPIVARHIIGFQDLKRDIRGLLYIDHAELHFDAGRNRDTLFVSDIESVFIGTEVTQAGGKVGDIAQSAAMAAPYDSGAAVTLLLRQKVDVLTITYRDSHNGLHAAIFALPKKRAASFRADLITAGARLKDEAPATRAPAANPNHGSVNPGASAGSAKPVAPISSASFRKLPALVEPLDTDVSIPPEFRYAIYEALIDRLSTAGFFSDVYRSGDRRAKSAADLVTVHTRVEKFRQGNQTERELITVAGATKVTVTVTLGRQNGAILQAYKATGDVRFFGENLGVALNLAKRITSTLSRSP